MGIRTIKTHRLVPVLLLLLLVGCKTWEPATTTPERLIADAQPSLVRVTNGDGDRMTLKSPMFLNDSLLSVTAPPPGTFVPPLRVGVPADDVALLEVGRFSVVRSIALAGAIAVASIAWAGSRTSAGGSEERPGPLPKDPALSLVGLFRLLRGAF